MSTPIYRQAALDRLRSPERLDNPYRLVSVRAWLALAAVIAALLALAVGLFFAHAPVMVAGRGIVLPEGGLLEIVAEAEGRIESLSLAPGQTVREGESVATFARTDLSRKLEIARADLADAERRLAEVTDFNERNERLARTAEDQRLGTIRETRKPAERRRELLAAKVDALKKVTAAGVVTRDALIDAELQLAQAAERLAELADETKAIELKRLERQSTVELAMIDERRKVESLSRQLEKLDQELAEKQVVTSAHAGQVVEVRVNRGDVIAPGAPLATLAPAGGPTGGVVGVLYLPPADGKRVAVGMQVRVEPSTARRQEFGYALATVTQVSSVPATEAGMRSILRNEQLVAQLGGAAAPIEVRIRFDADRSTPSGLAWSSSAGPTDAVVPGTLLAAQVVVERMLLVELVLPGWRRWTGSGGA